MIIVGGREYMASKLGRRWEGGGEKAGSGRGGWEADFAVLSKAPPVLWAAVFAERPGSHFRMFNPWFNFAIKVEQN